MYEYYFDFLVFVILIMNMFDNNFYERKSRITVRVCIHLVNTKPDPTINEGVAVANGRLQNVHRATDFALTSCEQSSDVLKTCIHNMNKKN